MALPTLGDVIRRQRELHDPSNAVVDAIAEALDVTSERLYAAAGIAGGDGEAEEPSAVVAAIEGDPALKPQQRRALIETYQAFVIANGGPRPRRASRGRPAS